ncbi:MAG: hypothetical protein MHM6MM_005021, partial [Cercozoa sp. M6MM]
MKLLLAALLGLSVLPADAASSRATVASRRSTVPRTTPLSRLSLGNSRSTGQRDRIPSPPPPPTDQTDQTDQPTQPPTDTGPTTGTDGPDAGGTDTDADNAPSATLVYPMNAPSLDTRPSCCAPAADRPSKYYYPHGGVQVTTTPAGDVGAQTAANGNANNVNQQTVVHVHLKRPNECAQCTGLPQSMLDAP